MNECSCIRDLLPLYEDGSVSSETAEYVKTHLESCPSCRKYYANVHHVARALQNMRSKGSYRYSDVVRRIRRNQIAEQAVGALFLTVTCIAIRQLILNRYLDD